MPTKESSQATLDASESDSSDTSKPAPKSSNEASDVQDDAGKDRKPDSASKEETVSSDPASKEEPKTKDDPRPANEAPAGSDPSAIAWLKNNGAPEDPVVKAFRAKHYQDVEDLTPEVLREVLAETGAAQGLVDRLVRIRTQQLAKSELLPAPPLKAGMVLDMSAPTLRGTDNVSMKLPDLGFGPGASIQQEVISAADLTPEQWVTLAKSSDMLSGIDLAAFHEGRSSMPEESFSPALNWVVPADDSFFNCKHLTARINTEITYSARQASLVAAGFTAVDASVSTPYVSASVAVETSNKQGEASASSHLYIVGTYDFDRVRVDLEKCTQVSQKFVDAVETALHEPNQKVALTKVFEKYGQVIGRQVTLGGRLYFVHAKEASEVANVESKKVSVSASISAAFAGFGGSVGVAAGHSEDKQASSQSMHESISFQATGGDVTLVNEPEKWKNTVKVPALWEVIRYDKLRYTYDLLPSALRDQVLDIWNGPDYLEQQAFVFPGTRVSVAFDDGGRAEACDGELACMTEGGTAAVASFGIGFDRKVTGLSVRYWGRFADQGSVTGWFEDGRPCSLPEKGAALQEFMAELTGPYASRCDLHYRARVGGKETAWVKSGESCGAAGQAIEGIQVLLTPAGAGTITIPAGSYVPEESRDYFDNGDYGPGVVMSKGSDFVLAYRVYYGGTTPVRRCLDALFAADEHRPVKVEFNQKVLAEAALDFATGGWEPVHQSVAKLGIVALQPGWNVLKVSRTGASPHFQEFTLAPEVMHIPAIGYNRSTCRSVGAVTAYGNGVVGQCGDLPILADYEFVFDGKKPTKLMLECVYAAADSRPVTLTVNGKPVSDSALTETTGGWYLDKSRAFKVGVVEINPGKNTLHFEKKDGPIPHIREFRLVPEQPFFDLVPDGKES